MAKRKGTDYTKDILAFFSPKRRDTAVKEEDPREKVSDQEGHPHGFCVKFHPEKTQYTIQCRRPQTVLQAIASKEEIQDKIKCDEDKMVLQMGKADFGTAIATHFPCTLLQKEELVTLTKTEEKVEVKDEKTHLYPSGHYYLVNIQTKGGANAKSKKLFKNTAMKNFSQLCVYGSEAMTLKEAIQRDGRFEDLEDFKLEDVTESNVIVFSSDQIRQHHNKTFRIRFERGKKGQAPAKVSDEAGPQRPTEVTSDKAGPRVASGGAGPRAAAEAPPTVVWASVSHVLETKQTAGRGEEVQEIYELLRAQFPELKKLLLKRIPQKVLKETLKNVDFGKAQQAFSDVGRMKKIFKMSEAVCKIKVGAGMVGSGFVLFKNYILTNAHLFKGVLYNSDVQPDIEVTAIFHYEGQDESSDLKLKVRNTFVDYNEEMDYAVLEVSEGEEGPVPPGLMKHCCPEPNSGEVCIVGHPKGDPKMFDPTCIIEKEQRVKQAEEHYQQFEDNFWALMSVKCHVQNQGIDRILLPLKDQFNKVSTYNTSMYHGSSGSPVFDAHCRVFGMHSGGFTYGFPTKCSSVIEFARPLLPILKKFVSNLRGKGNDLLLQAVEEELKGCPYKEIILKGGEPMDEL